MYLYIYIYVLSCVVSSMSMNINIHEFQKRKTNVYMYTPVGHMLPSGNKKFCSIRGERASLALQKNAEALAKGLRRAREGVKKACTRP